MATRQYTIDYPKLDYSTVKREAYADVIAFSVYPGIDNVITVTKNDITRNMKVKKSYEFIYQLRKTFINAIDGAQGLFDYLDEELYRQKFSCHARKVIDWIIEHGEPVFE